MLIQQNFSFVIIEIPLKLHHDFISIAGIGSDFIRLKFIKQTYYHNLFALNCGGKSIKRKIGLP